jgi:hypothetical protein
MCTRLEGSYILCILCVFRQGTEIRSFSILGIPYGWTFTSEGKSLVPYPTIHRADSMLPNTSMRDEILNLYEPA